jgi:hypothetical protein
MPSTCKDCTKGGTDQDFPGSEAVQERIEAKLQSIGLNDPAMKEAFATLHAMK